MICQGNGIEKALSVEGLSKEGRKLISYRSAGTSFPVAYEVSSFNQLVAEPNNQESGIPIYVAATPPQSIVSFRKLRSSGPK